MKTDYNPAVWKPTQKLAVLICLLWGQSLSGYGANLFTVISPLPSLSARADGPYTIGNSITVGNQALVVDKLGAMDTTSTGLGTDGFVAGSVQVGIWNAGGILLASATVTSADPLDGSYRYHALPAPITLAANTTYLIGARVGAGIEWFLDANLNPVVSADAGIGL
ncbi:MAG: hypothetical protein NT154_22045, partial [Verrucomicrobia bacterium]|nr:hypothetical protein [Verrucomicrobiota bacterium]